MINMDHFNSLLYGLNSYTDLWFWDHNWVSSSLKTIIDLDNYEIFKRLPFIWVKNGKQTMDQRKLIN